MNKNLLLLTAATAALLASPALATGTAKCDRGTNNTSVTTDVDTPLCTNTVKKGKRGNITIKDGGSVTIPSSSEAATIPAITINSNNSVTIQTGGTVSFKDTDSAIGIQLDAGNKGEFQSAGTIDLSGKGTGKSGILLTGKGIFTGGIDLEGGSALTVEGDGSTGIKIGSRSTLDGNVLVDGTINLTATSATATVASVPPITGIDIAGDVTGDVRVGEGSVSAVGAGAQGLVTTGHIGGRINIQNEVSVAGTQLPKSGSQNPEAGSAVAIGGDVDGGIVIGGPKTGSDTGTPAAVSSVGVTAAMIISPTVNALNPHSVTIGILHGSDSFINRGAITNQPTDPNLSSFGLEIGGNVDHKTVFVGNFLTSGTISSTASSSTDTSAAPVEATGILIGNNSIVPKIINSDASGRGSISATISGGAGGTATAIFVQGKVSDGKAASLTSIDNQGTISASASTTETAVGTLAAYAIDDEAGSITSIKNSGTISATATTLDADNQVAVAANLVANKTGVTFANTGTVAGDILFGTGGDSLTVNGSAAAPASIDGDIDFGGGKPAAGKVDSLTIGAQGTVTGTITEDPVHHALDVSVANKGALDLTNTDQGLVLRTLSANNGSELGLTVSQAFDQESVKFVGPLIEASGTVTINTDSVNIDYGSFLSPTHGTNTEQFVLVQAPHGNLTIAGIGNLKKQFTTPFLYTGGLHLVKNVLVDGDHVDQLTLSLHLKSGQQLGLSGYALQLYGADSKHPGAAVLALADDNELGGAIVGGIVDDGSPGGKKRAEDEAQRVFEAFAPNVSGETRAVAISITDQATGPVAARQRELRMYANQDSSATLWSQQFGESLNQDGTSVGPGFRNSGFGFALGLDGGNPSAGRYGGAFTFFSGSANEKDPRDTKTVENWYMLTGYTDWRGRGLFVDSQASVGIATIDGKRFLDIGSLSRTAEGKRNALMGALGLTTGVIFKWGGTVLSPQVSVDGMSMREEGYTEGGGGDGFDLHVNPYYANSLRGFAGIDLRQDIRLGDAFLQPEIRGGYRYDFLNGAAKTTANFAGDPSASPSVPAGSPFTIKGPDPTRGNFVAGGSLATTTDTWSIGLNYDVQRGTNGSFSQEGTISLIGKI